MEPEIKLYDKVLGDKKKCADGYHASWSVEKDDAFIRGEVCKVCGKKMMYTKGAGGKNLVGIDDIDFQLWARNHKVDFIQPFLPDGNRNPLFVEFYGEEYYKNTGRVK